MPAYGLGFLSIDAERDDYDRKEIDFGYPLGSLLLRDRNIPNWSANVFLNNLAEMESVDGKGHG